MRKYKKLILDMMTNIISFGIPILLLQFQVLPNFAKRISPEKYGVMLTITALVSIISEMTIGTLANIRILENDKYVKNKKEGIFKSLFYMFLIGSTVILYLASKNIHEQTYSDILLVLVYYILLAIKIYYNVAFRIENKYTSLMINNIIVGIGYMLGMVIFNYTGIWQLVYIVSAFLACIHLYTTTKLYKERPIFDSEIGVLAKKNTSLMFSYLVGNGMSYFDRIILYPIMGGESVSIYQVSTLMGKLYSLIGAPINMVILSYIAKFETITIKMKKNIILFASSFGFFYALTSIKISPYIIRILYPQYYELSIKYIPVVTIAITIFNISSILRVISMKTMEHKTILIVELIYSSIYIMITLILSKIIGLMGFCYAMLISTIIRYILYVITNIKLKN